jgi:exonuclease III
MPRFLFWNIDSLRSDADDQRRFGPMLADLARDQAAEIVLLAERPDPISPIHDQLRTVAPFVPIVSSRRFGVLVAFNPTFISRIATPIQRDRVDLFHVALPLQQDLILALVHGPDIRNNSQAKRELFLEQLREQIVWAEKKLGHTRTLVVGDFNVNPFESAMGSVRGMHAVMTRQIAKGEPRNLLDVSYGFFYNPMWSLYGDRDEDVPPATYYFVGGDPHEVYWHMLDQVVLRPSLIPMFKTDQLQILKRAGTRPLHTARGTPDRIRASDHFPLVFELDLRTTPGGVTHA